MTKVEQMQSLEHEPVGRVARIEARASSLLTSHRMLMAAWAFVGLIPYILMVRSYLNFATPHKQTETLVVPPGVPKETANLTEICSLQGFLLGQVWWNAEVTRYFTLQHGHICHFVVPQYNIHGNHHIGREKAFPYETSPQECAHDSYQIEMYLYHGSFGYFSFYEEQIGTYCVKDNTAYVVSQGLGTYDMNGSNLAEDRGSFEYRTSYWYSIVGAVWVVYRGLVLRRSYILCVRYGRRCSEMGVKLRRKQAVVFVHEQLRLTAHNATKLHRIVLLYLLVEGLMADLFLLIANNGFLAKIQYVSLGYNLSGLLLVAFEILESTNWLHEKTRVFVKRLLFCYESSLLGEIVGAALQQPFLSHINGTKLLEKSNHVGLAVSHYVWSIAGHGIFVFSVIAFIMLVRAFWAVVYVRWKHRTWSVFLAPCCVDTALGRRNKMTMLGGYRWQYNKLYYKPEALRSFGLLKVEEEDSTEWLTLRKLHWVSVPRNDFVVIGSVSEERVVPCSERPGMGIFSFFEQRLGGDVNEVVGHDRRLVRSKSKVAPGPEHLNIIPPG